MKTSLVSKLNPYRIMDRIIHKLSPYIKNDELYLKLLFFANMHRFLNLKHPTTFNEKLQWLKLNNQHKEYSDYVDKFKCKEIVRKIIGDKYIIPTLGIWDNFMDIDFNQLPNQFVLKCTHDSGGIVICKDKKTFDFSKAERIINRSLSSNFFLFSREYPYKYVQPRIIAEKFMVDESGTELKDYKFFCFNGEPKLLFVATDRPVDTRFDFFDMNFNHLPIQQGHPLASKEIKKPKGFEEMKKIAKEVSKGFPHVRIDLYDINGDVYFGETTFFHFSGNVPFNPEEWDYKLGEWLDIIQ